MIEIIIRIKFILILKKECYIAKRKIIKIESEFTLNNFLLKNFKD